MFLIGKYCLSAFHIPEYGIIIPYSGMWNVIAGGIVRGMLTAHSAPAFKDSFKQNSQDAYVWPDSNSEDKGFSIDPLYISAPAASLKDPNLYNLLACVDVLRIGRTRERNIAIELFKKAFLEYGKLP